MQGLMQTPSGPLYCTSVSDAEDRGKTSVFDELGGGVFILIGA